MFWSQRLSQEEGGTDGWETDDDRSALPLMCTYLPFGELCHGGDLCLKSPSHYHFHHLQHLPVSTLPCARRQSQAWLSLLSMQSGLQENCWIYLWEEFESIIYSHSLCRRRSYCTFMNNRAHYCRLSSLY